MSYLQQLQKHNEDLQDLIDKANDLPTGGGGGAPSTTEFWTVELEDGSVITKEVAVV